ncbi:hypothetical protein BKA81DRAFT_375282 [Phyllosticta paracitricarpa]
MDSWCPNGTYLHIFAHGPVAAATQCQHLSPVALGRELSLVGDSTSRDCWESSCHQSPPSPRPVTDRHHHNTPSTCSRLPRASFPPAACPGSSQPPPPPPPRLATSSPSSQHAQSRPGSAVQSPVLRPIPTPKTTNYTRCHAHRVCALLPGKFRMLVVRDIMSQCKSISGQFRVRPCLSAACQSTRQVFKSTADRMTAD